MKYVKTQLISFLLFSFMIFSSTVYAGGAVYPYNLFSEEQPIDTAKTVIGMEFPYVVQEGETLLAIALHFGVGYLDIVKANPGIDAWVPTVGATIIIPTLWVLPHVQGTGIVINLAELRLYHFLTVDEKKVVRTFPLGIGREGLETPRGVFRISTVEKNPVWNVPASIRREDPSLPAAIPPGPANPLGGYWLRLSNTSYGIHGTNKPLGVGRRVSHGCIRMYPEDIALLAKSVRIGTQVKIINQPVKIGLRNGEIFLEVNPYHEKKDTAGNLEEMARGFLEKNNLLQFVDHGLLRSAINNARGYPVKISKRIIKGEEGIVISSIDSQMPQ